MFFAKLAHGYEKVWHSCATPEEIHHKSTRIAFQRWTGVRVSPREKRLRDGCRRHEEAFTVGGANPQQLPDGSHAGEDGAVVAGIGDVGDRNREN